MKKILTALILLKMKKNIYNLPFLILFILFVPFGVFSQVSSTTSPSAKPSSVELYSVPIDDGGGGCEEYQKYSWSYDGDGDGAGTASYIIQACVKPDHFVSNNDDCDDNDPYVSYYTWYYDGDGDGFGDPGKPQHSCSPSLKYVSNDDDCDDSNGNINQNTKWYTDTNGDGVLSDLDGLPITQCSQPGSNYGILTDNKFHWIHGVSYDIKGNVTGSSRTYFDDLGKSDVSLSKDFVQNKIWGTETTYDDFGRPDKSSFIAPSTLSTFDKTNFFKDTNTGKIYRAKLPVKDILTSQDLTATEIITLSGAVSPGVTVNLSAPTIILSNGFSISSAQGSSLTAKSATSVVSPGPSPGPSLAGYYSDSNTEEPYQATAAQPYSQTNYDTLNPGNVINVVGGNKIGGEWKTGYSYTVPAAQEMYYVYGSDYYEGPVTSEGEEVITKFYKSVSVDANGVENVAFTDGEGKVLASARSGGATSYPVISLIGTQGFVDVHIPADITSGISLIGGASLYTVYDLKTGAVTSTLTEGNAYRIQANIVPTSDPKIYISGGVPIHDAGALGITYAVNYYDYAVNVYNKTGQLIKSIQPNGYVANLTIVPVPAHMTSNNFASTYVYNTLGQVVQTTSPDEGTSEFAYRNDGQIRYSQSALQADTKVSYTNYDTYARPIESGVLTGATGIWDLANAGADSSSLIAGAAAEKVFTVYDEAVSLNSDPNTLTSKFPIIKVNLTTVLTAAAIDPANYMQQNLSGNVAITYNKPNGKFIHAITWYSYDIYGRTEWIVQFIEGIGAKTIHYYYDYKGNVKRVIYQKDKSAELFAHQYTYDANDVLKKVQTSTDLVNIGTPAESGTFITHADYSYYQTGELKRVNIAEGLQGIDYVYTLGGALKSINHPSLDPSKDPGGDGLTGSPNAAVEPDVFGITLDYYSGDYLRTGRNIITSPTAVADYNGNIKATRWANKGIVSDMTGSIANQKGYLYNYDRNNWLTGATFGNTDASTAAIASTNNFSEGGLTYDANGNIRSLQRTNDKGVIVDDLTYNYTNSGKNQLNSVNDAVATGEKTDIENQASGNYEYDAIGQMTRNIQEDLYYSYNTQGLVTEVRKGVNPVVKFFYNERGQRIKKESYNTASPYELISTDYYVLDLSGNAMSIYNQPSSSAIVQKDLPIFGLSRLGVYNRASATSTYEITDHLGNVRAVVQKVSGSPVIQSFADYYPFGELLPNRNSLNYRYAFQGQELDGETGMEAFQLRLWDGRIGRWLSPDPYGQHDSPYAGMGNNPVSHIDPDGGYESWLGAFFGWAGHGFKGSIEHTGGEGNHNYSLLTQGGVIHDGSGNRLDTVVPDRRFYGNSNKGPCTGDCDGWLGSEFIGPTPIPTFYKRENAIDMVDIAAQKHDAGYILMGADGIEGALSNTKVLKYDMQLYDDSKKVYDGYYNGMIDTQTLKPISLKTQARAAAVMGAFGPIIQYKKITVLYPTFFPTMKFVTFSMHPLLKTL
jgi:RHS repeat-associated protein